MQLGDQLFGLWRQSLDRAQSIFALNNLTSENVTVATMSLNLIVGETWYDLLSGESITEFSTGLEFARYQCRWITNRQA